MLMPRLNYTQRKLGTWQWNTTNHRWYFNYELAF